MKVDRRSGPKEKKKKKFIPNQWLKWNVKRVGPYEESWDNLRWRCAEWINFSIMIISLINLTTVSYDI